ncbi:hypothetical protein DNX69_10670 [Rhodopseudomonas palustris]|uniref:Uncharacterized protein n=1 Tax=Rhodopseudomonas palustris TaxID=1076 RepID=A0A323UJY0_RHOPL|nr:hypothetical protein [Rhodopseudomonas palustris]PZA12433.1 hypothetical protein DNX69_10670 [Rhodopseudomonas palustris]
MTPDLSKAWPFVDFPRVRPAPLTQAERDAALIALWRGSRHLAAADREAVLDRYAPISSVQPSPTGVASGAGEPRHLRRVVSSGRQPAFPPVTDGGCRV